MPPPIWERLKRKSVLHGPRCIRVTFKLPAEAKDNLEAWETYISHGQLNQK